MPFTLKAQNLVIEAVLSCFKTKTNNKKNQKSLKADYIIEFKK